MSEYEVEARLSPFGPFLSLSVQTGANSTCYATATFQDTPMAVATSKALHGTTARSWQGNVADTPKRKDIEPGEESANAVSVV
jgi:hypothetical protein